MTDDWVNLSQNLVIVLTGGGGCRSAFGALMVDQVPDLHVAPDGVQSFPLYVYKPDNKNER